MSHGLTHCSESHDQKTYSQKWFPQVYWNFSNDHELACDCLHLLSCADTAQIALPAKETSAESLKLLVQSSGLTLVSQQTYDKETPLPNLCIADSIDYSSQT